MEVGLVILLCLGDHKAEVPCGTILFLSNIKLQNLLINKICFFGRKKKLEQESGIWIYPEEVPVSQRGEVLISLSFLVL